MRDWGTRFFSTTRGKVVKLLRRGEVTVAELADRLHVTNNAVRSHLNTLERDGLVRQSGKRPGVRKPETLYSLTPEAEELFPKAYHLLLNEFISVLEKRLGSEELDAVIREVGSDLASRIAPAVPNESRDDRLQRAVDALNGMGGLAEIQARNGEVIIAGHSCPLAASVAEHPEVCRLAQALLRHIVGVPVEEICDRGDQPSCAFRIQPA